MKGHNKVLVFDLETTGLDPARHAVIEIGAVLLDENLLPIEEYSSLVSPWDGAEIMPESMAVNRISMEELRGAPDFRAVTAEFHRKFGAADPLPWLAGWNVWFDVAFLKAHYERAGMRWPFPHHFLDVQSLILFRSRFRGASLSATVRSMLGEKQTHRAIDDARQTARVLTLLGDEFIPGPGEPAD
jgi:DNA polymerase III epsilon subunit-like protein